MHLALKDIRIPATRGYEFSLRVFDSIAHECAQLTSEMSS